MSVALAVRLANDRQALRGALERLYSNDGTIENLRKALEHSLETLTALHDDDELWDRTAEETALQLPIETTDAAVQGLEVTLPQVLAALGVSSPPYSELDVRLASADRYSLIQRRVPRRRPPAPPGSPRGPRAHP